MRQPAVKESGEKSALLGSRKAVFFLLLAITIFFYGNVTLFDVFAILEYRNNDAFMRFSHGLQPPAIPDNIVIIAIDEPSMQEFNQIWPWNRRVHGDLVTTLKQAGAAAVAFDVVFSEPDSHDATADQYFAESLRAAGNVILGQYEGEIADNRFSLRTMVMPIDLLKDAARNTASLATELDPDGYSRRIPLSEDGLLSFSLAIIEQYREALGLTTDQTQDGREQAAGYTNPLIINYLGEPRSIPTVSYYQALDYRQSLGEDFFRDKIVIVGYDLALSADLTKTDHFYYPFFSTSGAQIPGVEIHATVIDTLLRERFIHPLPAYWQGSMFLVLLVLAAAILWWIHDWKGGLVFTGVLAAYYLFQFALFHNWQYTSNAVAPIIALLFFFLAERVYSFAIADREKRFIRSAFSHYISPAVVEQLLDNPKQLTLYGERYDTTVLFSDLVGFTNLSEKMEPMDLRDLLSEYLGEMVEVIQEHHGTLDKFIGDAVMCFFGIPIRTDDHAVQSVRAAWEMHLRLEQLNRDWAVRNIEPLSMRIGLNSGSVIAGNLGTESVFNYTIIGDTVNLASRLESVNKQYGTHIMLGETTHASIQGLYDTRRLDCIRVKGKEQSVSVYELLGPLNSVTGNRAEQMALYTAAFTDYQQQAFEPAIAKLKQSLSIAVDPPAIKLQERCEEFIAAPPGDDWDGVYTMDVK